MTANESDSDYVNIKIKEIKNLYEKKAETTKATDKDDCEAPRITRSETRVKEKVSICQSRLEECKISIYKLLLQSNINEPKTNFQT